MFKNHRKLQVGRPLGGSKRGPCWGHVGVKLRLKGILRHLNIMYPTKLNLRGVATIPWGFTRAPGAPGEGDIGEGVD